MDKAGCSAVEKGSRPKCPGDVARKRKSRERQAGFLHPAKWVQPHLTKANSGARPAGVNGEVACSPYSKDAPNIYRIQGTGLGARPQMNPSPHLLTSMLCRLRKQPNKITLTSTMVKSGQSLGGHKMGT